MAQNYNQPYARRQSARTVESSMLTIYTRHAGDCDHRDEMNWRRCRCPKWIRGVLPNGRSLRTAAKTRRWEQAEKYARLPRSSGLSRCSTEA